MMKVPILSICIATYNRSEDLRELLMQILASSNREFVVDVTDNCSTDGTLSMLQDFDDDRLIIHENTHNIGGANNMVEAVFNSSAKYALYLNDREVFYSDQVDQLIKILSDHTYAYVYIPPRQVVQHHTNIFKVQEYAAGLASMLASGYTHHPSGMIYNSDIVRGYLSKSCYFKSESLYKHSLVALDVMQYEKTAVCNLALWEERPPEYKVTHISGTEPDKHGKAEEVYYHPQKIFNTMKAVVIHLKQYCNPLRTYTEQEQVVLYSDIMSYFFSLTLGYKSGMKNEIECAHYKIKSRFITTRSFLRTWYWYYNHVLQFIASTQLPRAVFENWQRDKLRQLKQVLFQSAKDDIRFITPQFFRKVYRKYFKRQY